MTNLKNILAINTAKSISFALKNFNIGSGTSLPGKIALKISPNILSNLVNQTKEEIISVTGTNGKTTTCGFIAGILKADNRTIAHNRKGANMLTGVTTAVAESSTPSGILNVDNCLLESDEAYLPRFADFFAADFLLVTNLFRDQLDRYGELDTTAKKIKTGIQKFKEHKPTMLVLNADDPSVAKLSDDNDAIFYGFDEVEFCNVDKDIKTTSESASCKCGADLQYSKIFYGHVGHYYCTCGYSRPDTNIKGKVTVNTSSSKIEVSYPQKNIGFSININMPGLYNAYNALGAIALALSMGISPENIINGIENYSTVFGRAEQLTIKGKDIIVQLIKNPAGATEVLRTVKDDPNSRLLIIINDNYADGRDVSWLWDANFELLQKHNKKIITSGKRSSDMAVRLKYAGINSSNINSIDNIKKAIKSSVEETAKGEKLYILPTYTALLDMQKIMPKIK